MKPSGVEGDLKFMFLSPAKDLVGLAGRVMRHDTQPVWRVLRGDEFAGWFVLDEVYGKHEFITYAVTLNPTGQSPESRFSITE